MRSDMPPDADEHLGQQPLLPRAAPVVTLTVQSELGEGQRIPLRRPVSIFGNRKGCKIQFRHPTVSALHCAVVNTGHRVFLRDLLSDSGTLLNDLRAENEPLDDGDMIRVGPWEFRVGLASASAHDLDDFTGINLEPAPAGVGLQRTDSGEIFKMTRDVNIIGRKNGSDVLLNDRRVSRIHALVFEYLSHPAIVDVMSENGVIVGGTRTAFSILNSNDRIEIGPFEFRARVAPPLPNVKPD